MSMMTSQILKSVDFAQTQKFRYPKNETLLFLQIIKNGYLHVKSYFMEKVVL